MKNRTLLTTTTLLLALLTVFLQTRAAARAAPSAAAPTTLTYPIVDTGQDVCYDGGDAIPCPSAGAPFAGQDAQHPGNPPSYTDNGDGTTTDNVTGLMWQRSPDTDGDNDIDAADKLTYAASGAYCSALTLAGYTDWRLPDIKQLYALIDFRGTDPSGCENAASCPDIVPFIDTTSFAFGYGDTAAGERLIDAQYASSTLYVDTTPQQLLFGVNFADGRIKGYGLTMPGGGAKTFYVICVRENPAYGQNAFTDNGDSTITDNATGLMWAQDDSGTGLNWADALAWVETQNAASYLGYNDWRLPNAKELQSLLDYTRSPDTSNSAAINPLFHVTPLLNEANAPDYPYYWASTTHANWTNTPGYFAVYVSFGRAMGYMQNTWVDVHGAGAQRSDPKYGDPDNWPYGNGPQGDAVRIFNFIRLVRDADTEIPPTATFTPSPTLTLTATITPTLTATLPAPSQTPTTPPSPLHKIYLPMTKR